MYETIKPLVERAEKHVQSLRGKKWNELTPEDVGKAFADLEGIIIFIRMLETMGVFALDERMRKLEMKSALVDRFRVG